MAGDGNTADEEALIYILGSMHVSYAGSNLSDDFTTIAGQQDTTDAAVLAVGMPFMLHFSVPTGITGSTGFSLV